MLEPKSEPVLQRIDLPGDAWLVMRPLGWREHSRCIQDSMDQATGRRDLSQYEYLVCKAALVEFGALGRPQGSEIVPCALPGDADYVLEALFLRHRDVVLRMLGAALSLVVRAEEEKKG